MIEFKKELFGLDKKDGFKVWTIEVESFGCPRFGCSHADIRITHGKEGGKLQVKVETVTEGKQGRSKQEQAILQAHARVKKQVDKGYRETKTELTSLPLIPMLAADFKKQGHRIKFPCFGSVKYDGVRCLVKCKMVDGVKTVTMESRTGQPYDVPHLLKAIWSEISIGEVWDGEIYLHGQELEDINSAVGRTDTQGEIDKVKRAIAKHGLDYRRPSKDGVQKPTLSEELENAVLIHWLRPRLELHVFDAQGSEEEIQEYKFEDRMIYMQDLRFDLSSIGGEFIKVTKYVRVLDLAHLEQLHDEAVDDGYEGFMVRNDEGVYESGKRSADLQKFKRMVSAEFEIVDITPDKDGNAVFTLRNDLNDNLFNCVMGDMHERKLFIQNKGEIRGQFMTVDFQKRYKKTLIPQFPAGKMIRKGTVVNGEFIPSM